MRVVALGGASYGLAVAAHLTGGGGWPRLARHADADRPVGCDECGADPPTARDAFHAAVLTAVQALLHLLFAQVDGAVAFCPVVAGGHHHVTAGLCSGCGARLGDSPEPADDHGTPCGDGRHRVGAGAA